MDHAHYDWSPIATRGVLRWPEQARVALCVVVNLEHTEWLPPADSFRPVLTGGVAPRPYPDYALLTHREYGHRVGIFRVLDVLEKYGITPTVAMDALTAEHYPYLVRHCLQRGCEIIGHGIGVRMINSTMSEQQEQAYIQQASIPCSAPQAQPPWAGWGQSTASQPAHHSCWRKRVSVTCVTGSMTSSHMP